MTEYTASATDKATGEKRLVTSAHSSKKAFTDDLHPNGYTVHHVKTAEVFAHILAHTNCEPWYMEMPEAQYIKERMR